MSADPVLHLESDRLVELAHGDSATEGESRHMALCAECRTEIEMVSAAAGLGRGQVPEFDAGRIAAGIRRRLTASPIRRPVSRIWWLGGLAAAALAVFAMRSIVSRAPGLSDQGAAGVPALVSVLHELDDLDEPQLEAVLQSLPPAAGNLNHVDMAPLSDLNAADLEQMLRSMEDE